MSSPPAALKIFHNFSLISGHKLNLNKSSLLPLNTAMSNLHLDVQVPVVTHFKYLGIDIDSSLEKKIISKNYKCLKKLISDELNRWCAFSIPLSTWKSVVKSDIPSEVNFYANTLHLPPPAGFWENIRGLAFKFVWQNQQPRISRSTLQKSRTSGGLSLPNFEMYFVFYTLRSVSKWFDKKLRIILFTHTCLKMFSFLASLQNYVWKNSGQL